jgi:hypothetical protein
MNVVDLDGIESRWKLAGNRTPKSVTSKFHKRAKEVIGRVFPTAQYIEEVTVKLRKGETVYLDFYIPMFYIAIEVQGQQHYGYNPHFHTSRLAYYQSLRRDERKKEWCEINKIKYIEFPYKEKDDEWTARLTAIKGTGFDVG